MHVNVANNDGNNSWHKDYYMKLAWGKIYTRTNVTLAVHGRVNKRSGQLLMMRSTENNEERWRTTGGERRWSGIYKGLNKEAEKWGEMTSQSDYGLKDIHLPKIATQNFIFQNLILVLKNNLPFRDFETFRKIEDLWPSTWFLRFHFGPETHFSVKHPPESHGLSKYA